MKRTIEQRNDGHKNPFVKPELKVFVKPELKILDVRNTQTGNPDINEFTTLVGPTTS